MNLDDGRLLIPSKRYEELLLSHTPQQLSDLKLVPVSSKFQVIALGLPVPRYQGYSLDPPLRSRFQARDIPHYNIDSLLEIIEKSQLKLPPSAIQKLLGRSSL